MLPKIKYSLLIAAILILAGSYANAQEEPPEIGIQENLGDQIPPGLEFTNSTGEKVKLKELIDKPTVLALVYYKCPGVCSPLLTGMGEVLDKIDMEPGKHFRALSISFDPTEGPELAKKWKNEYLTAMERDFPESQWNFMTGDSANIKKLAEAAGFYYKPDGKDFIHAATLIVLTPEGKISRYLFGTEFLPFDVEMAITEASEGKSAPAIKKALLYCFSYDPEGKGYVLNFNKVAGTVIVFGAGIFLLVLLIKGKNKKDHKGDKENG
ncbi:MAG: SCO family protein [Bacteroidota bacterium]